MNKDKLVIDLWYVITLVVLAPNALAYSVSNTPSSNPDLDLVFIAIGLISYAILGYVLTKCSKLEKHRYLVVYTNCQKVSPKVNRSMVIGFAIAASLALYLWWDFTEVIATTAYCGWLVIISTKFEDGSDSNE